MKKISCVLAILVLLAVGAAGAMMYRTTFGIELFPTLPVVGGSKQQIAFINFPLIIKESAAGKSLSSQVVPRQEKLKSETEAKLKELQQQQQAIKALEGKSPKEEIVSKNTELKQKIDEWNEQSTHRQADINDAANVALKGIEDAVRTEVADIAEKSGYAAVLPMEQAFYVNKGMDITSEVMGRLDKKLTKIDIKFDEKK